MAPTLEATTVTLYIRKLYKKYILNPSDNTKANFVQFKNKLKSLLRPAEKIIMQNNL